MTRFGLSRSGLLFLAASLATALTTIVAAPGARALDAQVLDSVVSVLPKWPGFPQGGQGAPPGTAPEGSAVVIAPGGYLVTAAHVVDKAESITLRLADGRRLPAELVGSDQPTDIAVLKIDADPPPLAVAPPLRLGQPVCAVGNTFGLGLSVSCGVVSALHRSNAGFNPVEDFVQTDAAMNPGDSGGALVDAEGRFAGLLSAIFAFRGETSTGVNFAVSRALTLRVAEDLIAHGRVLRVRSGMRVTNAAPEESEPWPRVTSVLADGAAADAGIVAGDRILEISGRPIRRAGDVTAAFYLHRPGDSARLTVLRDGQELKLELKL